MRFDRLMSGFLFVMACLNLPLAAGASTLTNADLLNKDSRAWVWLNYNYTEPPKPKDEMTSKDWDEWYDSLDRHDLNMFTPQKFNEPNAPAGASVSGYWSESGMHLATTGARTTAYFQVMLGSFTGAESLDLSVDYVLGGEGAWSGLWLEGSKTGADDTRINLFDEEGAQSGKFSRLAFELDPSLTYTISFASENYSGNADISLSNLDLKIAGKDVRMVESANPVPIPGAVWLLGSGLAGLLGLRRRQTV